VRLLFSRDIEVAFRFAATGKVYLVARVSLSVAQFVSR